MKQKQIMQYLVSLMLAVFILSGTARAEELRVVYDNFPPLSYEVDGKVQGVAVDMMNEACERLGFEPVYIHRPFARALMEVEIGKADCVMSVYKSEERKKFMHYPEEGLVKDAIILLVRKGMPKRVHSLETVESTVGAVRKYYYGEGILERLGDKVSLVNSSQTLYKMFSEGRYHLLLGNKQTSSYYIDELDLDSMIDYTVTIESMYCYVAFSKRIGRGKELADRFGEEFAKMRREKIRAH